MYIAIGFFMPLYSWIIFIISRPSYYICSSTMNVGFICYFLFYFLWCYSHSHSTFVYSIWYFLICLLEFCHKSYEIRVSCYDAVKHNVYLYNKLWSNLAWPNQYQIGDPHVVIVDTIHEHLATFFRIIPVELREFRARTCVFFLFANKERTHTNAACYSYWI